MGNAFEFKELQTGHLWVDRMSGTVDFTVEYRTDDDPCWHFWTKFQRCFARTSCEDLVNPICYPITPYREGDRKPLVFPHPPQRECMSNGDRPAYMGYAFQVRISIVGFCRVRGLLLYATRKDKPLFEGIIC